MNVIVPSASFTETIVNRHIGRGVVVGDRTDGVEIVAAGGQRSANVSQRQSKVLDVLIERVIDNGGAELQRRVADRDRDVTADGQPGRAIPVLQAAGVRANHGRTTDKRRSQNDRFVARITEGNREDRVRVRAFGDCHVVDRNDRTIVGGAAGACAVVDDDADALAVTDCRVRLARKVDVERLAAFVNAVVRDRYGEASSTSLPR